MVPNVGERWGARENMSDIVARILLILAYVSILGGTMGWFETTHVVMR
jgi:hypothetical protein